jgi:glutamate-ammonia-ligase adenylyltransferase
MVRASERAGSLPTSRLLESFAGARADDLREAFKARAHDAGLTLSDDGVELGALVLAAYPELGRTCKPSDVEKLARGTKVARDTRTYRKAFYGSLADLRDAALVRKRLREFAAREKLRIAVREILHSDVDIDVTARELADLAEVCIEVALSEALLWAEARFGVAVDGEGRTIPLAIIGMGKLGGRELNAGSDVDLLVVYDSDEGVVREKGIDGKTREESVHEYMTRVTQRTVQTLEEPTDDGIVWRVDMRLRPEGTRGPLVNSLAAIERYYETWGRTWERAALLRARPVAGDIGFGKQALAALMPFVWRREVNPHLARELTELVARARAEGAADTDLKVGKGGIREAEFFVQSLQLIWGGRDPHLRAENTLEAVRRLRSRGFVTEREMRALIEGYVFLRRLEHRVQFATMRQTHEFPSAELRDVIGKSVGLTGADALVVETDRVRTTISLLLASLSPATAGEGDGEAPEDPSVQRFFAALDENDEAAVSAALPVGLAEAVASGGAADLGRHLVVLARRPDFPLGAKTRDDFPGFAELLLQALSDAANSEQAARLLVSFFSRVPTPSVYVRALAADTRATRRVVGLFGASAFLAESLLAQPALVDRLLFVRKTPADGDARAAIEEELESPARPPSDEDDPNELLVSGLRRAKSRVMLEVGLADLSGELGVREAAYMLTELADATLERATAAALAQRHIEGGLAVIAMGKLGGRELGYGSDLDLFFVYDAPPDDADAAEAYVRCAQRVMRLLGMPHGDGPGYELDARLRPSGNQGLLVVSLEAFARYHSREKKDGDVAAADWERQALVKARPCAGDAALGARVLEIAHRAAYEGGAPPREKIVEMRMRMEKELAGERKVEGRARYDLKLGHGGIVDVEFCVQYLQMKHGRDPRVRTTDTESALHALEACGYLEPGLAGTLREGYTFLRRLEQRLRVLHGTSATLLEEGAHGLTLLARRMGMRRGPLGTAQEALLRRYLAVTREVRVAFTTILG